MYRIARLLFICAVSLTRTQVWAQNSDFLQPAAGYFSGLNYASRYYPAVQTTLLVGLSTEPEARVVVLPSFAPEYVVSVDKKVSWHYPSEEEHYYLTYRISKHNIWHLIQTDSMQQVRCTTHQVELTQDFAQAVGTLFNTALLQTRYPKPDSTITLVADGTTFVFINFRYGIGLKNGTTLSPALGSKMAALTSVVDGLIRIAKGDVSKQFKAESLTRMQALTYQIDK